MQFFFRKNYVVHISCARHIISCARHIILCARFLISCARHFISCARLLISCARHIISCARHNISCARHNLCIYINAWISLPLTTKKERDSIIFVYFKLGFKQREIVAMLKVNVGQIYIMYMSIYHFSFYDQIKRYLFILNVGTEVCHHNKKNTQQ